MTKEKRLKAVVIFAIVLAVAFVASVVTITMTKVWLLSAIDLSLFSLLVSLATAASVLLFVYDGIFLTIKLPHHSKYKLFFGLILLLMIIGLIVQYSEKGLNQIVFEEWGNISPLSLIFSLFVFLAGLYVPAYVLHSTIIRRFKFGLIERITFYPVISGLTLGFLRVLLDPIGFPLIYIAIFICFLAVGSLILLRGAFRNSEKCHSAEPVSFDVIKVLGVFSAIAFSLFLIYSALGDANAFLRGDMWGEAQAVALFSKYGLNAFFSSPVAGYPPFYSIFWSILCGFLSIPQTNGLIFTAFFNHVFSILALYLLAKVIFKDGRIAVLSVILWTVLSDFSWLAVSLNPPGSALSGTPLLANITAIFSRFGLYSGARVSPIYADGHTLTRLWSLGLLFISAAAIIKACSDKNRVKEGLFIFSIGILQILLGHITEVPILSIILLISILLLKPDYKFFKLSVIAIGSLTALNCLVTLFTYGVNYVYVLISISPLISLFSAFTILKLLKILRPRIQGKGLNVNFLNKFIVLLSVLLFFFYGLMFIAFFQKGGNISYPIATIWYFPAIEWGFLGVVAVVTLAWLGPRKVSVSLGLKVTLLILGSLLLLLFCLNYLNYNFSYIENPYPFEPILFLPFLALVGAQSLIILKTEMRFSKIKLITLIVLFVMLFSFGPLDHVLNASYSRTNGGWWSSTTPVTMSKPDFELMNFLYKSPPRGPYDFMLSLDNWTDPLTYVVYPSGMTLLSPPLINILSQTTDSEEFYQLTSTFPINYLLVPKDRSFPPFRFLSFNGVNDYANIPDSISLRTPDAFTVEFWIVLENDALEVQDIFSQRTLSDKLLIRRLVDDRISFFIWADGQEKELIIPALSQGELYHLAITYNREIGLVKIYQNGVLISTMVQNGRIATDDMTITLGKFSNGDTYYFDGMLSMLQVYDRALSVQEISQIYLHPSTLITYEGALLQLPLSDVNANIVQDISGNSNNALLFGATIKPNELILVNIIGNTEPLFSNEKYDVYSISHINMSQTISLNTTAFLTFEQLTISGNLTLKDAVNGEINYENGEFEIFTGDNGKCVLNVLQQGIVTQTATTTTPFITIEGNMSFIGMKSSWDYFREMKCMADNLTISGKSSFQVPNTFNSRVYAVNFSYSGEATAYPAPEYLRADYIKTQIDEFYIENYISPWDVVTSSAGVGWASFCVLLLILTLLRDKLRGLFKKSKK